MSGRLVSYSPNTPTRRHTILYRPDVDNVEPCKALTASMHSSGGRNCHGRTTVRFRGGGHKRKYRIVNFKKNRELFGIPATVLTLEYDPNRTANIALIQYENGVLEYMVAPEKLSRGQVVMSVSDRELDIQPGNVMPAKFVPVGTQVSCIELKALSGAVLARSAGCYASINGKERGVVNITLSSREQRIIHGDCLVMIGAVSNPLHKNRKIGKAGRNRWLGKRPHQRGVSMNPVDHPLGGGEGKSSGGRHPVSPWGQCAKGLRTRRNKRTDAFILRRRSKKSR